MSKVVVRSEKSTRRWAGSQTAPAVLRALSASIESLESRTLLSTYLVNTTTDSGAGSLRQAMLNSNANPASSGANEIDFAIGTGQQTITLASPLPTITAPLYINGTTQPGYGSQPLIQISGVRHHDRAAGSFDGAGDGHRLDQLRPAHHHRPERKRHDPGRLGSGWT